MAVSLAELASLVGAELHGDGAACVERVATLDLAGPGDLAFLYDRRYRSFLRVTAATAVILPPDCLAECRTAALVAANPHVAYARAAARLQRPTPAAAGTHPSASIAPSARIAPTAAIAAQVVVEEGACVGDHVVVGPGSVIGRAASIGDHSLLHARVTVCEGVVLGRRCIVHAGAVLGADGFGYARDGQVWLKIPQVGGLCIGDDVEIGANTTIDRGAIKDTRIDSGVKIDNLVQIGHNVHIGADTAIAGCVGIAGSTVIGRRCMIGGGTGIGGHLCIADDVVITGMSMVTKSIERGGVYASGWPARAARDWRRVVAWTSRHARRGRGEQED